MFSQLITIDVREGSSCLIDSLIEGYIMFEKLNSKVNSIDIRFRNPIAIDGNGRELSRLFSYLFI